MKQELTNLAPNNYQVRNDDDKFYFAIYCNVAQHNAMMILNFIYSKVKQTDCKTKEDGLAGHPLIQELLQNKRDTPKIRHTIELLSNWLPFSAEKDDEYPHRVAERLKKAIKYLSELRNFFSHQFHGPLNLKDPLGKHIERNQWHFEIIKKEAAKKVKARFNRYIDEQKLDIKKIETLLEDRSIYNNEWTDQDVIFFICLFLERVDANQFISKISGFKRTDNEFRYTREFFQVLCCKLPTPKVVSTQPATALMLRILNELARVPEAVFQHLTPAHKALMSIEVPKPSQDAEEESLPEMLLYKRHEDRFSYFALMAIEYLTKDDNILQFQLNLGKKHLKPPYQKTILEDSFQRELTQEILCFGRLTAPEIQNAFQELRATDPESGSTICEYPLKQFNPNYHFSNNRIGIKIKKKKEKHEEEIDEQEILLPNLLEKQRPDGLQPDCILSVAEIPYLLYGVITKNDNKYIGSITQFIERRNSFLNEVLHENIIALPEERMLWEKHKLKPQWVPQIILDYLNQNNENTLKDQIERRLKAMEDETEELLIKYEKGYAAKPGERLMKTGEMAQWLARDIVKLTPPRKQTRNGKQVVEKLSSAEYDVLQSRMAFFGRQENLFFEELFKELRLTHNEFEHPFLKKISTTSKFGTIGLKGFFNRYLIQRKRWLDHIRKNQITSNNNTVIRPEHFYFFHLTEKKNENEVKQYIQKILKEPVYLPRGLFLDLLTKDDTKSNLFHHLRSKNKGQSQWFYNCPLVEKAEGSAKYQRDKLIRQQMTQDWLLWDVVKALEPTGNIANALMQKTLADYTEPTQAGVLTNLLSMSVTIVDEIYGRKTTMVSKIKDSGKINRIKKDRRLEKLVQYYPKQATLDMYEIEKLLGEYPKLQKQFLEKVFELEKRMFQKYKIEFQLQLKNKGYFKYSEMLKLHFDSDTQKKLTDFRNAFLHNQLPKLDAGEQSLLHQDNLLPSIVKIGVDYYLEALKQLE